MEDSINSFNDLTPLQIGMDGYLEKCDDDDCAPSAFDPDEVYELCESYEKRIAELKKALVDFCTSNLTEERLKEINAIIAE